MSSELARGRAFATGGPVSGGPTYVVGEIGCGLRWAQNTAEATETLLPISVPLSGEVRVRTAEGLGAEVIDCGTGPLRPTVHATAERLDRPPEIGPATGG